MNRFVHERQSQNTNHTHESPQSKHCPKPTLLPSWQLQLSHHRHGQYPDRPIDHDANDARAPEMVLCVHAAAVDVDVPVCLDRPAEEDDAEHAPDRDTDNQKEKRVAVKLWIWKV